MSKPQFKTKNRNKNQPHPPWPLRLGQRAALVIFPLALVGLAGAQLILANQLATEGEQIRAMEERWMALEVERRFLEKELVALGSLSRVRKDAEKVLGMRAGTAQQMDYFTPPVLAARP